MKFFLNDIENSIAQYFKTPFDNVELKKAIESVLNADTLKKIDNNTFNLKEACQLMNHKECEVIQNIAFTMSRQLSWSYVNNDTGYFGVIKNQKFGSNWSYLNLIENQYRYAEVIYAPTLSELERKVTSKGHIWYVFDEDLARKTKKEDSSTAPIRYVESENVVVKHVLRKHKRESKFKGLSAYEVIKKKKVIQDKVLRRSQPTSMIEKMFI